MVQMYHPQNHGTIHPGTIVVKCTMVFGVVQLPHGNQLYHGITMVKMYHPKSHDTIPHDSTMVTPWCYVQWFLRWYVCTMVISHTMVRPWYNCTTTKTMVQITAMLPW
jgi:hypothetical protein